MRTTHLMKLMPHLHGHAVLHAPRNKVCFCNSAPVAEVVAFTNEIKLDHDGWAQLAPFGDYPGQALLHGPGGEVVKFDAIQRLDRIAADAMVARFKSPWQRVKRYFTG